MVESHWTIWIFNSKASTLAILHCILVAFTTEHLNDVDVSKYFLNLLVPLKTQKWKKCGLRACFRPAFSVSTCICISTCIYVSTLHTTTNHHSSYYDQAKWLLKIEIFLHTDIQFFQFIKYSFLVLLLLTCQIKVYLIFFSIFTCKSKITSSTFPMWIMILLGMSIR